MEGGYILELNEAKLCSEASEIGDRTNRSPGQTHFAIQILSLLHREYLFSQKLLDLFQPLIP